MGIGYSRLNYTKTISEGNTTDGVTGRTMEGKRNACTPERIKKGGRGL